MSTTRAPDESADEAAAPSSARAVWFSGPGRAELRSESVPSPQADEITVESIVSLVSAGTEMNVFRGDVVSEQEVGLPTRGGSFPFPIKFAYQVVGRVVDAGAHSGFVPGDVVFAKHPHQERFTMATAGNAGAVGRYTLAYRVPADVTPDAAAFANLLNVAYGALLDVPVRIGDVAVVTGLGVIGTFVGALARRTAGRLVLVDPLAARRERATWIGADAVVGPDDARAVVNELSDGRGADVSFEASGAGAGLQTAIDVTAAEGTISVLSYYGSREIRLRLSPEFHLRRQRIVSSLSGAVTGELQPRWTQERRMDVVMEQLRTVDVAPLVSHRLRFSEAPDAYALIAERPDETLGVLLEY